MQTGETGRGCRSEPRHGNRVGLVLVAAVAALFTTGCLTSDAYVTVDGDGSGELRMEVFPPPEVSDTIAGSGVDALIRSALEGVEGATFESGERSGQRFYSVKIPFDDYRQLTTNIAEGATIGDQALTPFAQFDLRELPDGGWSLAAVTNPLDRVATFTGGSPLQMLQGLAGTEEAGVGLSLSVTLPGRLTDSNADSQDGNTAEWKLNDPSATYELRMRTEPVPLLSPIQWFLIGLVGVFLVGAVLMFVGATGPVKRWSPRKRKPESHDAFLHKQSQQPLVPSETKQRHARRHKRIVAGGRTGWEDPGAPTTTDPAGTAGPGATAGEQSPQPQLPPITMQRTDEGPPDAPSSGERVHPPEFLPTGPEPQQDQRDEDR